MGLAGLKSAAAAETLTAAWPAWAGRPPLSILNSADSLAAA